MERRTGGTASQLFGGLCSFWRRYLFGVLSAGHVPDHIAFIMDGNRRYAKKRNMAEGDGHKAEFSALLSMLRYCYELGVKYVTVYAFSIDNFKRQPKEVQSLMDLMQEKIEELLQIESIINEYGIRLHFIGNLATTDQTSQGCCREGDESNCSQQPEGAFTLCGLYFT